MSARVLQPIQVSAPGTFLGRCSTTSPSKQQRAGSLTGKSNRSMEQPEVGHQDSPKHAVTAEQLHSLWLELNRTSAACICSTFQSPNMQNWTWNSRLLSQARQLHLDQLTSRTLRRRYGSSEEKAGWLACHAQG